MKVKINPNRDGATLPFLDMGPGDGEKDLFCRLCLFRGDWIKVTRLKKTNGISQKIPYYERVTKEYDHRVITCPALNGLPEGFDAFIWGVPAAELLGFLKADIPELTHDMLKKALWEMVQSFEKNSRQKQEWMKIDKIVSRLD